MPDLCYSLDGGETFHREPLHDLLERDREYGLGSSLTTIIEADVRVMTIPELAKAVNTCAGLNGYVLEQLDDEIQVDWFREGGWFDDDDRHELQDADFFDAAALTIAYGLAHACGLPWRAENQRVVKVEQDGAGRWSVVLQKES